MSDDDIPDIGEIDVGDTVRVEYRSQRSGNTVDREGEAAETAVTEEGNPIVYVHDEQQGFFSHTYVALLPAETNEGNDCIAAVSISTQPATDAEEPPGLQRAHAVTHEIARRSTLGIVTDAIIVHPDALTMNTVL